MFKVINLTLYISISFLIIIFYLNVPVYCSMAEECNWYKYLIPIFVASSMILLLLKIQIMNYINYKLILFYAVLLFMSFASYALLADNYAYSAFKDYLNALILMIFFSIFFIYSAIFNRQIATIFCIATMAAVSFNLVDMFAHGIFFKEIDGFGTRAAGFYVNANDAAFGILIGMILGIKRIRTSLRIYYVIICLIGIFITFSRGGLIVWLLLYIYLIVKGELPRKSGIIVGILLSFSVIFIPIILDFLSTYNNDLNLMADRLNFFSGSASTEDLKEDSRYSLVSYAIDAFISSPIFGHGANALLRLGSDQLSHNQYLAFLSDYGIIGLVIYIIFIITFFVDRPKFRDLLILVLIASLFSHNIFNSYAFMIAFAYIANYRDIQKKFSTSPQATYYLG